MQPRALQEAAKEERRLATALHVLEQRLQSCTYLVNDAVSLADVVVVCDLLPAFRKVCQMLRHLISLAKALCYLSSSISSLIFLRAIPIQQQSTFCGEM